MSCIQCRTVTPRPFRIMGVSMNRHEADARAIVTPVSTSHNQGELALRPASSPWLWLVDRKSTRLNSSHLVISYAVFCLKKKKTGTEDHAPRHLHRASKQQYLSRP